MAVGDVRSYFIDSGNSTARPPAGRIELVRSIVGNGAESIRVTDGTDSLALITNDDLRNYGNMMVGISNGIYLIRSAGECLVTTVEAPASVHLRKIDGTQQVRPDSGDAEMVLAIVMSATGAIEIHESGNDLAIDIGDIFQRGNLYNLRMHIDNTHWLEGALANSVGYITSVDL